MAWSRRWLIDSRARWRSVVSALLAFEIDPARRPVELIVREERIEKSGGQRRLWHAVLGDLAPRLGLSPKETKQLVKEEFYGVEVREVLGRRYRFVPSTEDSDRDEYGRLIEFTYQLAAENGIELPDRRLDVGAPAKRVGETQLKENRE